jgi:hypothetical protein
LRGGEAIVKSLVLVLIMPPNEEPCQPLRPRKVTPPTTMPIIAAVLSMGLLLSSSSSSEASGLEVGVGR